MKTNRLLPAILCVVCILFLLPGCEEETAEIQELSPDWFDRFPQPTQQTSAPRGRAPLVKKAKMVFANVVHDFGTVAPETSNLCEFKFKNTGNDTLTIENIEKACGCTPFLLEKSQYAPGESGTVRVNYVTDTQLGPTTKELTVISNDAENPEITLAVKATVRSKIDYEPKTLDLVLKGDNGGCPPLTITSVDGQPFSISYIVSTSDCITADFDPSVKATSFTLRPKVDMAKLETVLNGDVEIGLTHPQCKKIQVAMKTLPRYTISPTSLSIRGAVPNTTITRKVRIINNYGEPFSIADAVSKNGRIRVSRNTVLPGNRGYELELEITPPAPEGRIRTLSEELTLGLAGGFQLKVPCYIFYSGSVAATGVAGDGECKVCGAKIIDPRTGKITYANPKAQAQSGS
jgi:hypothetical protein